MLAVPEKYKLRNYRYYRTIIWILNPLCFIWELIFGIRIPKNQLIEKDRQKPLWERTFYPCPHCNTIHNPQVWSSANKTDLRNWFGLYCPNCGKIIPCVTSLSSYLVLFLTAPLWLFFRHSLKRKWLSRQPGRFQKIDVNANPDPYPLANWIPNSLSWGLWMFLLIGILVPLAERQPLKPKELLVEIIWWILGGFLYGYFLKLWYGRQKRKGKLKRY